MSTFSGEQHVGAMREHRKQKQAEAKERNRAAHARMLTCGHVHGKAQAHRCAP